MYSSLIVKVVSLLTHITLSVTNQYLAMRVNFLLKETMVALDGVPTLSWQITSLALYKVGHATPNNHLSTSFLNGIVYDFYQ